MSLEAPTFIPDEYDSLFDPNLPEVSTDPNELNRVIEAAAIRPTNVTEVLSGVTKNQYGFTPDADESLRLIAAFGHMDGFNSLPESETQLQVGIARARQLVGSGQASSYLARQPFISDEAMNNIFNASGTRQKVTLQGFNLVVDPSRVLGANGFTDWRGRGVDGSITVKVREGGNSAKRTSMEQISDYATRDTALPPLDDARVLLTDAGTFVYAGNAHRAAAAKLRDEDLQLSGFVLYDVRGKTALFDQAQQHTYAAMQSAAQTANR